MRLVKSNLGKQIRLKSVKPYLSFCDKMRHAGNTEGSWENYKFKRNQIMKWIIGIIVVFLFTYIIEEYRESVEEEMKKRIRRKK